MADYERAIDETVTFYVNLHSVTTGGVSDGDAAPTYRIYEDETGTPILTGTMALLDDGNTVGFYSEQITCSAANGFEIGKTYCIRKLGVVGGVTSADLDTLTIIPTVNSTAGVLEANAVQISGDSAAADNLEAMFDGTGYNAATSAIGSVADVTGTISDKTGYALSATGSAALTESYAADGAAATLPQLLYMIQQRLTEFSISGVTVTINQLDGTTPAATLTLNSATTPTSSTRAT